MSGPSRADIRAVQQIKNVVRILFGSVFLLGAAHVPEDREALLRAGDGSAERGREPRLPKRVVIPVARTANSKVNWWDAMRRDSPFLSVRPETLRVI